MSKMHECVLRFVQYLYRFDVLYIRKNFPSESITIFPERDTFQNSFLLSRDPYSFREDCSCLFHSKLFCEQILTSCLISKSGKIIRCYLSPWVTALARRGKCIIVQLSPIGERKRHLVRNKNSLFRRLILILHKMEKLK